MDLFIEKTFSQPVIAKAKATMEEFKEDPKDNLRRLYDICVHLEVCYLISNMHYLTKEGECFIPAEGSMDTEALRAQFEIIEGLPRQMAWFAVRTICEKYKIDVPKYMPDLFDYKTQRFIEVGVTRGLAETYFQRKKEKLGDSMEIWIFSYGLHVSSSRGDIDDTETAGRILTRLMSLRSDLALANLWGEEDMEGEWYKPSFPLGDTLRMLREDAVPSPFQTFEEFRTYVENYEAKGAIKDCLARMDERVNVTARRVTWDDIIPVGDQFPEGEPCPYNSQLLMADDFCLVSQSDGSSKRPKELARKCLETAINMAYNETMQLIRKSDKANEVYLWSLWRSCCQTIMDPNENNGAIASNSAVKWATGDGLAYERVSFEDALNDERMKQDPTKGPEKCKPAAWVQNEMNKLSGLTTRKYLDLPELGPEEAPIEYVGSDRRKFFIGEVDKVKACGVMMKLVRFNTALLNEACASMDRYKVIPITGRYYKDSGQAFDSLYGFAVKGKSHLRADTDVMSYATFEFSLTNPEIDEEKWKKYTVFKIGDLDMGENKTTLETLGKPTRKLVPMFLYCRVNGANKIKMKWGMETRRCLLQAMQQMESMIDESSSQKRRDMTSAFFQGDHESPAKAVTIGLHGNKPVRSSFGKTLRVLMSKVLMHFVYGDAQLEGFSAETRRLMLIVQALKDKADPHAFDLKGLYKGINECCLNNPLVLQSCIWMNQWISCEKQRALSTTDDEFVEIME